MNSFGVKGAIWWAGLGPHSSVWIIRTPIDPGHSLDINDLWLMLVVVALKIGKAIWSWLTITQSLVTRKRGSMFYCLQGKRTVFKMFRCWAGNDLGSTGTERKKRLNSIVNKRNGETIRPKFCSLISCHSTFCVLCPRYWYRMSCWIHVTMLCMASGGQQTQFDLNCV